MQLYSISDSLFFRIQEHDYFGRIDEIADVPKVQLPFFGPSEISMEFGAYKNVVAQFKKGFQENFTRQQNLEMLYRLKDLRIKDIHDVKLKPGVLVQLGLYNNIRNTIYLYHYDEKKVPMDKQAVLIHELFHMASTRNTKLGYITGLEVPGIIGTTLNEGYTEYLTEKYFTRGMKYTDVDDYRIRIVKGIENMIGAKKMEEYYFDANIGNLVRDLSRDIYVRDVLKLLYMIDHVDKPFYSRKRYRQLINSIADMNQARLDRKLRNGEITPEEYDIEVAIKVKEYREYRLWSEETKVIKDKNCFVLKDYDKHSNLYQFKTEKNPSVSQKIYQ